MPICRPLSPNPTVAMEELRRNYFTRAREPYPTDLLVNETRLVALLPGKWNDDVRCELFRVSSERPIKHPPYQALSYAWGAPGHRASHIQLNGCEFAVTMNLGTALRFLRDNEEPVVLWIDALVRLPIVAMPSSYMLTYQ
jgi:hypothetical protein